MSGLKFTVELRGGYGLRIAAGSIDTYMHSLPSESVGDLLGPAPLRLRMLGDRAADLLAVMI